MKIGKRGNALWVRIPVPVVKELNLKAGEEAELVAIREHSFEIRRVLRRESAGSKTSR
jgi:antitoxin component of MazEF toxin-antitoxin module